MIDQVGNIDGIGDGEGGLGTQPGFVMVGDGLDDGAGQSPEIEQVSAEFGVGGLQNVPFGSVQGEKSQARFDDRLPVFFGEAGDQDHLSGVVENSGHRCDIQEIVGHVKSVADAAGQGSDSHAMLLKLVHATAADGGVG